MESGQTAAIAGLSPNRLVPYLEHRGAQIWESLAIVEYCAEFLPALWPAPAPARAHAPSIAAEMHPRFRAVRLALPQVVNTPELRFDCDDARKFAVISEVAARLREQGAKVSEIDGVRVQTADGWWLLRASNTQAVLVARAEASGDEGLERLKHALVEQLAASGLAAPDFSGANAGH